MRLARSLKHFPRLVLTACWILLTFPLAAQVAGFTGNDDDRDGLPDDFEQAILEKFRPTWKISGNDCNGLPAEFLPGVSTPTVKAQNGTIYGQVFIRGTSALGFFVEAHFYDLWAADCGYINSHPLDSEHISALIRVTDPSLPLSEWHASQWYAGAHEDTLCDSSQIASALTIDSEDKGATVWIARGKHGAFFSQQVCGIGGCGLDRCEGSTVTLTTSPINIGEPNAPLNGAVWTASDLWPGPLTVKMRTDFATFSSFASLAYALPDKGGSSFSSTGAPVATAIGYAAIQPGAGAAAPAGVSIFSARRGNVLVTEAGVPASAPVASGRIYVEVGGSVNTGLAIANPNNQPSQIAFFLTNSDGQIFRSKTITIPAKTLTGSFLDESPFDTGSFGRATLTFTASPPVSIIALRGLRNERDDFLITTLPVLSLSGSLDQKVVFPHFADGGGWTTQFVLVNPTDQTITGTIEFFGQGSPSTPADPLELILNGQAGSRFSYTIAPRSYWLGRTAGAGGTTSSGSVRVTPATSQAVPSGIAIFSFRKSGIVVTESGVATLPSGSAFRLFTELSGNFNTAEPGSLQTGIAIANQGDTPATLTLELTTLSGSVAGAGTLTLPSKGQTAMFLNQMPGISDLPPTFQGILRISTSSSSPVSVTGLRVRYNERRDFLLASTPVVNESLVAPEGDMFFPYFVDGGGYTTQFILTNTADGQSLSGWVRFYSQLGTPRTLALR